jgi:hypothetical protein
MSCFEVEDDDLDLLLIKYNEYYLSELTFYGSSKTKQMLMLIGLSQELNLIEKNIIDNYYNLYVVFVKKDINDSHVYYLLKIFFTLTNLIIKMTILLVSNKKVTDEFEYKSRYLVGAIENYIEKILLPIEPILNQILNLNSNFNSIFKLENSILHVKKFIELNRNKFTSREKLLKLNKLLNLLDKKN